MSSFTPIRWLLPLTLLGNALPALAELPKLLPVPAYLREADGSFRIDRSTRLIVPEGDEGARNAALRFAELVQRTRGLKLKVVTMQDSAGIRFQRSPGGTPESYRLEVGANGATITAGGDAGLLYGGVTLWQAMTQDAGRGAVSLDGFTVQDAPRFAWRGLMLDSARHFQSPAYVRQLIDWMAANKLNTLHWHLVDDQGWRIEIKKYPRLTEVAGWRVPASVPGAPHLPKTGGFYTQDEIRAIVAYAAQRNVTIVPEIEMPGHALSAIRAYPQVGMGVPIPPGTESDWGVFPWLYNVDDSTFAFLEDVLGEVIALFPSRYIHVGGDEATKEQWKASPAIQAKMRELGITSENALQTWFMARIGKFLTAHDRKMIGWDEILEGGVPPDATITSWRGIEGAITAAKLGHDAVLSPAPVLYLDHRQGSGPQEPPGRGKVMDLNAVYAVNPAQEEIPTEQRHHILGLQGNLWTEHVRTEARTAWMQFPRGSAIAEIGWSPESKRSFSGFVDRLVPQLDRMKPLGLEPASSVFAVTPDAVAGQSAGRVSVSLTNQAGFAIRYTTDGRAPTAASPLYSAPLDLPLDTRLRATSFHDERPMAGALDQRFDAASLRRRTSTQMQTCSSKVDLALEDDWPAKGPRAVFLTDILDPCWTYKDAPMDGVKQIAIEVGQIPFNFQISKAEWESIRFRPPVTPEGEMEVRTGGCDGERVAVLPLAPAGGNPGVTRLVAPIRQGTGKETLCITYTAKGPDPLWSIRSVELLP